MKLLTYDKGEGPRAGVKTDGGIVDLTELLNADGPIIDIMDLMEKYPEAVEEIRNALEMGEGPVPIEEKDVKLCAPILHPHTLRDSCMFETHSTNAGKESNVYTPPLWYERPIFYYQNPNDVYGPEAVVPFPEGCTTLDYEAEVAIVIGRRGYNIGIEEADKYILGITIFNDWSDREACGKEAGFLGMHKSKDFAAGFGPYIVTLDEIRDKITPEGKLDLKVKAWVNDIQTTDSTCGEMYYSYKTLFSVVAKNLTVQPGDITGIGTVGLGCIYEQIDKFPFLKSEDKVTIEVEGIGRLTQYVK